MQDQPVTGILDQVQDDLKAVCATVVRVRHYVAAGLHTELGQEADLVHLLCRTFTLHRLHVVHVHHQDEVVLAEVVIPDQPRPKIRQVVSALGGMGLCPLIRWAARVVVVRACRVDADPVSDALVNDLLAEDAVSRGTAADVAHADKKNRVRLHCVGGLGMMHCGSIVSHQEP